jgi:hypothetical protein
MNAVKIGPEFSYWLRMLSATGLREGLSNRLTSTYRGKKMADPEDFEVVVLASGEAGKILAWTLASQGQRSARAPGRSWPLSRSRCPPGCLIPPRAIPF